MLYALLALAGLREIADNVKYIRRKEWAEMAGAWLFSRAFLSIFGLGTMLVGLGGFWAPLSTPGWLCCAAALWAGTFMPCGYSETVNRVRALKILRNLAFVTVGCLCAAKALGLLAW